MYTSKTLETSTLVDELKYLKDIIDCLSDRLQTGKLSDKRWLSSKEMSRYLESCELELEQKSDEEKQLHFHQIEISGEYFYDRLQIETLIENNPFQYERMYKILQQKKG